MTINIFVLKGDLNGKIVVAFLFLYGIYGQFWKGKTHITCISKQFVGCVCLGIAAAKMLLKIIFSLLLATIARENKPQ